MFGFAELPLSGYIRPGGGASVGTVDDVGGVGDVTFTLSTGAIVALVPAGSGVVIFAEVVFNADGVGVDSVGIGVALALLVAMVGNVTLIPAVGMLLAST